MSEKTKITIVGSGYVGMSLSVLLSEFNDVTLFDIDIKKVNKIKDNISPVADDDIEKYLSEKKLSINATHDKKIAFKNAQFIVIATPTNFDINTNAFDTSSVDSVAKDAIEFNKKALIIIKSTIPVGHTESLNATLNTERIIFSPEFLREGKGLRDNLYPSRIVVGVNCNASKEFAKLLKISSLNNETKVLHTNSTEAEAIKLFSNTFLAMRVSFFNELDSYSMANDLNTKNIIEGVCLDERIGNYYNNPSFGYGGYCLPKDTKQLLSEYNQVPQTLVKAIVTSNKIRKDFIIDSLLSLNPKIVGIYLLAMKQGSDNFRSSAIIGLIKRINKKGVSIVIFEPKLKNAEFLNLPIEKDLNKFKNTSDIILANRMSDDLEDVKNKVFTRDIFNKD